jgi:hypothetical protein
MLWREGRPMTEAEWLAGNNPHANLFELERRHASARKLRLFCCACVRRIWRQLADSEASRRAVEVAELFADERVGWSELVVVEKESQAVNGNTPKKRNSQRAAAWCASEEMDAVSVARSVAEGSVQGSRKTHTRERCAQVSLLRDIFGNPFRPVTFCPEWRTDTAVSLARQMYESRDFSAMPILADALQDAGCEDADILGHCRGPGPHVRGCWVVDLVLGKE